MLQLNETFGFRTGRFLAKSDITVTNVTDERLEHNTLETFEEEHELLHTSDIILYVAYSDALQIFRAQKAILVVHES